MHLPCDPSQLLAVLDWQPVSQESLALPSQALTLLGKESCGFVLFLPIKNRPNFIENHPTCLGDVMYVMETLLEDPEVCPSKNHPVPNSANKRTGSKKK